MPPPPFDALPLQKDGPQGNAWGQFGAQDELGQLNRLTPENTLAATKEIVHGTRVCTDWALNGLKQPCFGRRPFEQKILNKHPRAINDDELYINTQSSTQWDGFRHCGYQDQKVFFNGCKQEDIEQSDRIGTHVWVENGGIVGRGVLLDYLGWAESQGIEVGQLTTHDIKASDLDKVAEYQKVAFRPNDILFVRSGYINAISSLSEDEATLYQSKTSTEMPAIGVESNEAMLRWLWDKQFVAVAGDMIAFESLPFQGKSHLLHEWLIAGWGLPIGELFDLEALTVECKRLGKWSFFFSSVPLRVPGGVASPPNGVAIF